MIITRTPYRLSLFGGGTDYNEWYRENGGLVIGSAFNKYCWINLRSLPPFFYHKTRVVYSQIELVSNNDHIDHAGIRSCLKYLNITDPLEIHCNGDLPARSGIGSSSSFTVGLLNALYAYLSKMPDKRELAEHAIHVEQNIAKDHVGIQDQILASYGGIQVIEMGPGDKFVVKPLMYSKAYRDLLESHIMIGFSGMQRTSSIAAYEQIENIKNESSYSKLRQIQAIAGEAYNLLRNQAPMRDIGELFDATWRLKRTLTASMSNDAIDEAYKMALSIGAYGGRLMGAGNGGFIMLFADPSLHETIKSKLETVKVWVPFKFEDDGSKVIFYNN